jgi:ketosteroid isomerase-like protein
MTTDEVAQAFAALCREDRGREAADRFWADDVVSIEPMDGPMARLEGREAVLGKHAWWDGAFEVHGGSVEGPFVHGDQFALRFALDATDRKSGVRESMREIGLYTVRAGKVVEERFFYAT